MTTSEWKRARERAIAECVAGDHEAVLVEMGEAPDAHLVRTNGAHVGLEIVSVVDGAARNAQPRMDQACADIQSHLDGMPIALVVYFDVDALRRLDSAGSKRWKRELPERVRTVVSTATRGFLQGAALDVHRVGCVAGLEWAPDCRTHVAKGWSSTRSPGLTRVDEVLAKKDERLLHYRRNNHFAEYWLAIDCIAAGKPDYGFSLLLDGRYDSAYDRVFLLEASDGQFVRAHDVTKQA